MLSLATAAILFAMQPAAAGPFNAAAPENRQVLPAFSYATVEPVLTQIGARFERTSESGRLALTITFANGRRAAILFGSCLQDSCRAISIQAVWSGPPADKVAQLANAVVAFNQRYAFSRALVAADGRPTLQRYLTADFGFVRGNLAVNLIVFAGEIDRFVTEVINAPAAPPPPPAQPPAPAASPPASPPATPAGPAAPRRRPGTSEGAPHP
jgi:hypothetical protein